MGMSGEMENDTKESPKKDEKESEDDFVDPWKVVSSSETGVDYNKLISKYYNCHLCVLNQ